MLLSLSSDYSCRFDVYFAVFIDSCKRDMKMTFENIFIPHFELANYALLLIIVQFVYIVIILKHTYVRIDEIRLKIEIQSLIFSSWDENKWYNMYNMYFIIYSETSIVHSIIHQKHRRTSGVMDCTILPNSQKETQDKNGSITYLQEIPKTPKITVCKAIQYDTELRQSNQ